MSELGLDLKPHIRFVIKATQEIPPELGLEGQADQSP